MPSRIRNGDLAHYADRNDPLRHLIALQRAFSRAHDELCNPDEYLALVEKMEPGTAREKAKEVACAYAVYERTLRERGACDFGGLLVRAVALLRDDVAVREWARHTYRSILVDEYQDVNHASRELLRLLAGEGAGLWAVGDPPAGNLRLAWGEPCQRTRLFGPLRHDGLCCPCP